MDADLTLDQFVAAIVEALGRDICALEDWDSAVFWDGMLAARNRQPDAPVCMLPHTAGYVAGTRRVPRCVLIWWIDALSDIVARRTRHILETMA